MTEKFEMVKMRDFLGEYMQFIIRGIRGPFLAYLVGVEKIGNTGMITLQRPVMKQDKQGRLVHTGEISFEFFPMSALIRCKIMVQTEEGEENEEAKTSEPAKKKGNKIQGKGE